jgi:hypothetical protein
MAYFEDLSEYSYHQSGIWPGAKNIGWLDPGREFAKMPPAKEFLDLLWEHCKLSVVQMRGIHECEFCVPAKTVLASRKDGIRRLLGTSEIRVFSKEGHAYAAPTLIYHYINTHHYRPPEEFVCALKEGPWPPSLDYFDRLENCDLGWEETLRKESLPAFKFERKDGVLQRVSVQMPVYLDEI